MCDGLNKNSEIRQCTVPLLYRVYVDQERKFRPRLWVMLFKYNSLSLLGQHKLLIHKIWGCFFSKSLYKLDNWLQR